MSQNWPTIEEAPLHGLTLEPGCFWACDFPERPWDPALTTWDWRCRACFRHGEATLHAQPDAWASRSAEEGGWTNRPFPLAQSVIDAREYHEVEAEYVR